ncbi:hypothetical protein PGT21_027093 [Puccinia graminis f. sp. tritici]|uniref:Uncharacterized protein n=1 Tax=Puccinia graminis f. sp. tritici TaxID=56615 RepID=A0A5B0NFF2_PUCGR|nr:hypothetical protein PGT21_027093 [Puccinia graminis f. sp. tritici]
MAGSLGVGLHQKSRCYKVVSGPFKGRSMLASSARIHRLIIEGEFPHKLVHKLPGRTTDQSENLARHWERSGPGSPAPQADPEHPAPVPHERRSDTLMLPARGDKYWSPHGYTLAGSIPNTVYDSKAPKQGCPSKFTDLDDGKSSAGGLPVAV